MLTFQAEVVEPEPVPVQEEVAAYSEVLPYFLTLTLLFELALMYFTSSVLEFHFFHLACWQLFSAGELFQPLGRGFLLLLFHNGTEKKTAPAKRGKEAEKRDF